MYYFDFLNVMKKGDIIDNKDISWERTEGRQGQRAGPQDVSDKMRPAKRCVAVYGYFTALEDEDKFDVETTKVVVYG